MADQPETPKSDKQAHSEALRLRLALQALHGEVQGAKDRLAPLEDAVGNIVDTIDELAARQKAAKPAPAWWPELGGQTGERWDTFLAWLRDTLAVRYPSDTAKLTTCWVDHPPVVDALTALWLTWQAAYLNPSADARDAAQWMTTWRVHLLTIADNDPGVKKCRAKGVHIAVAALDPDLLVSFR